MQLDLSFQVIYIVNNNHVIRLLGFYKRLFELTYLETVEIW